MDLSTSSAYAGVDVGQTPHILAYAEEGSAIGSMADTSDIFLVAEAKEGDHQAYAELCRRHSRQTFLTILRITRNDADAEDTLQEALLKAYVHIGSFEGRSAFSSWLIRIAINSALMLVRKKRSQPVFSLEVYPQTEDFTFPEPRETSHNPEESCILNALENELAKAIRCLPSCLRVVIQLRCQEHASVAQIAKTFGISESAVKVRLFRARSGIRKHLGENPYLRRRIDSMALSSFNLMSATPKPASNKRWYTQQSSSSQ